MTDVYSKPKRLQNPRESNVHGESDDNQSSTDYTDSSISLLFEFVQTYKWTLLRLTFLSILLSCLNLSLPLILKLIIDNILPAQNLTYLSYALGTLLAIIVLKNLIYYYTKVKITELGERIALEIRDRLFHHLHQLSVRFFKNNKPGKLSSRLMQDVNTVKTFIQDQMMKFVMNVLMVIVAFGIMAWLHLKLALVAIVVLPIHWIVHRIFKRSIKKYARKARNTIGSLTGDVVEQFSGAHAVKSSGAEKQEEEKFEKTMRKGISAKMKETRNYLRQKILADGLVGFGQLLVIGIGAYAIINGTMEVGAFVAFYGYTGMLYPKTLKLIGQAGKFSSTAASFDRIFEIMTRQPEIRERNSARRRKIEQGKVEFRNVSFAYDQDWILSNINFTIEPGENVMITGVSGSGKTTLLNLIPRFYDPQKGVIRIDDINVKEYTLESLRKQIGIVFQDCFLFGSSVHENIRYARPDASTDEILDACIRANAHEFIRNLPNGYLSVIGEGESHLSGGEKQRLVIARTILKDPSILILDEALSSLDSRSRRKVAQGLSDLIENRTLFMVTHETSSFVDVDRKIHLTKPRV